MQMFHLKRIKDYHNFHFTLVKMFDLITGHFKKGNHLNIDGQLNTISEVSRKISGQISHL